MNESCRHTNIETRTIENGEYTRCNDCGTILMTRTAVEVEVERLQEENTALRLRIAQLEEAVERLTGPLDKEHM